MIFGRWNSRKCTIVGAFVLFLLIFITSRARKYKIETMIRNTKPEDVWEYMSDFSRISSLNPLILGFKITSDSGQAHDWRYTVEYSELLSHFPFLIYKGTAEYVVRKPMIGEINPKYTIESKRLTCFFNGYFCSSSSSEFTCRAHGADAHCMEHVVYYCPPLLNMLCTSELKHQRQQVMDNLTALLSI